MSVTTTAWPAAFPDEAAATRDVTAFRWIAGAVAILLAGIALGLLVVTALVTSSFVLEGAQARPFVGHSSGAVLRVAALIAVPTLAAALLALALARHTAATDGRGVCWLGVLALPTTAVTFWLLFPGLRREALAWAALALLLAAAVALGGLLRHERRVTVAAPAH